MSDDEQEEQQQGSVDEFDEDDGEVEIQAVDQLSVRDSLVRMNTRLSLNLY
jgi:hypothetical protein